MSFFKKLKEKFVKNEETEKKEQLPLEQEEETEQESLDGETEVKSEEVPAPEKDTSEETAGQASPEQYPSSTEQEEVEEADEEEIQSETETDVEEEKDTIASKFKRGLQKTRNSFSSKINDLVARYRTVDEDFFEELEEVLISADVGVTTVMEMIEELEMEVKRKNIKDPQQVKEVISEKLVEIYYGDDDAGEVEGLKENPDGLTIYLFVGVNGVGKTTTIGKLAHRLKSEGKNVTLAAGDTFRAGAIEQLEEWGKRVGVNVTKHSEGSDPAAVIFDGIQSAKSRNADVLICDTAGRLQNKVNLMNELSKVKRVIEREAPGAPHEVLLVLDATTGQNAMSQAKTFAEATDVSGIVLSKLDGTAKGGIVLAIRKELDIPVKLVGLGEKVTDLENFDAHAFVYGLFADMIDEYEEDEEKTS
ncbi:signal recognition particle-docking protein FtsY [Halobacillus sp. ACCC02827]|uniref:signal recognition particle-docking protein FtsY n=1 Tax=unclassified Halobacillus TaxID=2636472 RepID=UPI0002A50920|nr:MULTISPECIES: signal recognition particle-docking protein FtsY [unclassified Halobacillus]ELK45739.1 signal recognition particle-docking protein FtsY [Halobacillus sp. BAB-2008]WJE17442.1 signal recognition particle-docking protein FtsY [Halobacillus sp. ACCC02827]